MKEVREEIIVVHGKCHKLWTWKDAKKARPRPRKSRHEWLSRVKRVHLTRVARLCFRGAGDNSAMNFNSTPLEALMNFNFPLLADSPTSVFTHSLSLLPRPRAYLLGLTFGFSGASTLPSDRRESRERGKLSYTRSSRGKDAFQKRANTVAGFWSFAITSALWKTLHTRL